MLLWRLRPGQDFLGTLHAVIPRYRAASGTLPVVGVHIVFPAFSIGLAAYLDLYRYWIRIFSIVFGMSVVSGLVMSYEFRTNWSVFSQKAGPITGMLLSYEVMTAFFLEAGFPGIMLFGMNRVGRGLHYVATCCVSVGTLISMTWILASNSWMQTPQGYVIEPTTGRFIPAAHGVVRWRLRDLCAWLHEDYGVSLSVSWLSRIVWNENFRLLTARPGTMPRTPMPRAL